MNEKWNNRFLKLAHEVASWSKNPGEKVGAIIIDGNKIPRSFGFAGLPRGVRDDPDEVPERYIKPAKLKWMRHAESNSLINCAREGIQTKDCTMFVTHYPCSACAGEIINAGIQEVVIDKNSLSGDFKEKWAEDIEISNQMFDEAGIKIVLI
jgi:dCMP deaminase